MSDNPTGPDAPLIACCATLSAADTLRQEMNKGGAEDDVIKAGNATWQRALESVFACEPATTIAGIRAKALATQLAIHDYAASSEGVQPDGDLALALIDDMMRLFGVHGARS